MREVDRRCGAVIFTSRMNRRWVTEAAQIFGEGFGSNRLRLESAKHCIEVELGVVADQRFGERRRLNQKEPVVVRRGQRFIDLLVHRVSREDIENRELRHTVGMITRQTVGNACAAVMAHDGKVCEAQSFHDFHLIVRRGAF